MAQKTDSSDKSDRSAQRAAFHSPETLYWDHPGPFDLELGGRLERVRVGYRTWGRLAPDGRNAVVVCHALTGTADVDSWWARMFGPGRAFDPDRDFVICANILGSCYGTTGPTSVDPATGEPYRGTFPAITVRDMVRVQKALTDALGVRWIPMVIGGSLGGMQVLEWALLYPERVGSVVFIASTARHSAWAIGLSEAQRQAIFADPRWKGGRYDPLDPPDAGLAAARAMAMCAYRSMPSFEERFSRRQQAEDLFAVESYLRHQGRALVERFDAATYVTLTEAMDCHDVARGRGDFEEVLRSIRQPTLVVSIDSDVLYWPAEQREVARLVPSAKLAVMDSPHGHDAFLIDVDRLSDMVADFRGEERAASRADGQAVDRNFDEHGISLFVLGKGKVGAELLDQLASQRTELERDYGVVLRVVGIADTRGTAFDPAGLDLGAWRPRMQAVDPTGPVDPVNAPALLDRLGALPRPVLVDLTAADRMEEIYEQAFRRGIDVVGSNKRPLVVPQRRFDQLRELRRQHRRHHHFDTTVGASLPVIGTLRRLLRMGDKIRTIDASLSGTLGFVCTELTKGSPLSLAVRWAHNNGYTEADPRDDLTGLDSARKAVILAREMGLRAEVEEVRVTPLFPQEALRPGTLDELYASLRLIDGAMAADLERRRGEGGALRFLAHIAPRSDGRADIQVGPVGVPAGHPAARLSGVEAMVAFTTDRHSDLPLVVQGVGVGGSHTAGAVLAEIFRLYGQGAW
jgi:homoserine O-acetyltransferase